MITGDYKMVSDFCNISLFAVRELSCLVYELLLHDALINRLSSHEKGQELLQALSRIAKKDADVNKIREQINS